MKKERNKKEKYFLVPSQVCISLFQKFCVKACIFNLLSLSVLIGSLPNLLNTAAIWTGC